MCAVASAVMILLFTGMLPDYHLLAATSPTGAASTVSPMMCMPPSARVGTHGSTSTRMLACSGVRSALRPLHG